jgi:RNA polymerase sigma-70 factor, ECF subfamily
MTLISGEDLRDMDQPPDSLLDRLRRDGSRQDWERFVDHYGPLLEFWARQLLPPDDAADLIQEVLLRVLQNFRTFTGEGNRSFLAWLRAVMRNRWRDLRRRAAIQPCTADSAILEAVAEADDLAVQITTEDRDFLNGRALQIMQTDFEPTTWRACWERVVADRHAVEVAAELGVSVEVVYSATYRVIRRLRSELAGAWG